MSLVVDFSVRLEGQHQLPFWSASGERSAARERGQTPWTAEALLAEMDAAGVDIVGLGASQSAAGVGGFTAQTHVDAVQEVIEGHDRLFGWVGIDPTKGLETLRYINYAVEQLGFKGVHCYPHWYGVPVNDRMYWPVYAKCAELGVPLCMQVGYQTRRAGARMVAPPLYLNDVAFDFPELTFIGQHIGGAETLTDEMVWLCQLYENMFILADVWPASQWTQRFKSFIAKTDVTSGTYKNLDGDDKVMWGTCWPAMTFADSLAEVRSVGFAAEVEAKLLGENTARIYKLETQGRAGGSSTK